MVSQAQSWGRSQPSDFVDSMLEHKLHVPSVRAGWVPRARLLDELDRASIDYPVALVVAPAGYGKTTLLAQWLPRAETPQAAWVTLDAGDNDPGRFWTHVAAALERAGCVLSIGTKTFLPVKSADVMDHALPRMVNVLASLPHEIVIVLDDFHFIREAACHTQVEFLIEHLPAQAHLVIGTRSDPGLRLGRLRASGRLAEIRADDLRFTAGEAADLLSNEGRAPHRRLGDTVGDAH